MKSKLLSLVLFLSSLAAAQADPVVTSFTLTSTALGTAYGYTAGQAVTFVFTTESSFADNASSSFTSVNNYWIEESTSDAQMWAAVSGTGLTGSYVRPTTTATDPNSRLVTLDTGASDRLQFEANADASNIGLSTPSAQLISSIQIDLFGVTDFAFSGSYSEPTIYFAPYNGVYGPSGGTISLTPMGQTALSFTPISLTISTVPEPSTYAIMAGLVALTGTYCFRRRMVRG